MHSLPVRNHGSVGDAVLRACAKQEVGEIVQIVRAAASRTAVSYLYRTRRCPLGEQRAAPGMFPGARSFCLRWLSRAKTLSRVFTVSSVFTYDLTLESRLRGSVWKLFEQGLFGSGRSPIT